MYLSPSSPPLQFRFKENAKILSKNSTTRENITISRQNLLSLLKTKTITPQQVTGVKIPNLVLKRMLELLFKNFTTQENTRISRLKEDYKTYTKKKTSKQKLNQ